jgi:hypothetical protein
LAVSAVWAVAVSAIWASAVKLFGSLSFGCLGHDC